MGFIERSKQARLVEADALYLISHYNDQAYREARDRARGKCLDKSRSASHWKKVKLTIAAQQRLIVGAHNGKKWQEAFQV